MMYDVKEFLKKFFGSRLFVLSAVFFLMFFVSLLRVFSLQIVNGKSYQDNFVLRIQKILSVPASRGCIYDCEGRLLGYNELAYSVSITDSATYSRTAEKNRSLNAELAEILKVLEENQETLSNSFKIDYTQDGRYQFNVSGTALNRFRADVFGRTSIDMLRYNDEFGFDELNATEEQIMTYLKSEKMFDVDESYPESIAYGIVVVRYTMNMNYYTRYRSTTIAENVSDRTVAYINEHMDTLPGVSIAEDTIRRYNYSEYFSSIVGYTGKISDAEYEELSKEDDSYSSSDIIGKAGVEQYYESYLRGKNGEQKIYVDNLGRVSEVISNTDSVAGNDLYLSIDAELQKATYLLLEQEIAGVVYANIKKQNIPIDDVYFALINNSVIDIRHFKEEDASKTEKSLQKDFERAQGQVMSEIKRQLSTDPIPLEEMSEEILDDFTLIMSLLRERGILLNSEIDGNDEVYVEWKNQKISPREYLNYCISQHWIDISLLTVDEKYADSGEIYQALSDYIMEELSDDIEFAKLIYQYMLKREELSPRSLCIILFEQGILDYDDKSLKNLKDGTLSPFNFLLEKIDNIELTPAQLALDPCTGSCVITDTKTGEIKALVSYPGYDNNRLANGVDAEYFEALRKDLTNPLWNYATQERTAPGSTFKMVTAVAGLAENLTNTKEEIECNGVFLEVDNEPTCWIYPRSTHGYENVTDSIKDSCNVFHYTLGYRMATKNTGTYNDASGIEYIQKYASLFGLNEKTGLEIEEYAPEIATQYPVMAAIGQSNNNFTTVSLARYVTAVASGNLYSFRLMSKIVDANGQVVESYEPVFTDISGTLTAGEWKAVRSGMRQMVQNSSTFNNLKVAAAGKTGTAQQIDTRPNHALFVGYAPYSDPEITITTRIAYGYTSHNAAAVSRNIIACYYGETTLEDLLKLKASGVNGSSINTVTD